MAVHVVWSDESHEKRFHATYHCGETDKIGKGHVHFTEPPDDYTLCEVCDKALRAFLAERA